MNRGESDHYFSACNVLFTSLTIYVLFVKMPAARSAPCTTTKHRGMSGPCSESCQWQPRPGTGLFPAQGLQLQGDHEPGQDLLPVPADRPAAQSLTELTLPLLQGIFFVGITCFVYLPRNIFDQRSQGLSVSIFLSLILRCLYFLGHLHIMLKYEHVKRMYSLMYV